MNWLLRSLSDAYWSLRHILGFWPFVIFKILGKGVRFLILIALAQGVFYLVAFLLSRAGRTTVDLNQFFPQTFLSVLAAMGAVVLAFLLLHEPARQYFIVRKQAERQLWHDVDISLKKYPAGHRLHGIVMVVRNYKWYSITDFNATVVHLEQNGVLQGTEPLVYRLPQARDQEYIWEKATLTPSQNTVEFVLVNLADEGETYGNVPSDGQTHESQAFLEIKSQNGEGLLRVGLSGLADELPMQPKLVEYKISWKDGKLDMKTETPLARWTKNRLRSFQWNAEKQWKKE